METDPRAASVHCAVLVVLAEEGLLPFDPVVRVTSDIVDIFYEHTWSARKFWIMARGGKVHLAIDCDHDHHGQFTADGLSQARAFSRWSYVPVFFILHCPHRQVSNVAKA